MKSASRYEHQAVFLALLQNFFRASNHRRQAWSSSWLTGTTSLAGLLTLFSRLAAGSGAEKPLIPTVYGPEKRMASAKLLIRGHLEPEACANWTAIDEVGRMLGAGWYRFFTDEGEECHRHQSEAQVAQLRRAISADLVHRRVTYRMFRVGFRNQEMSRAATCR